MSPRRRQAPGADARLREYTGVIDVEWLKFLAGLVGIWMMIALPFAVLVWVLHQFYRGLRGKVSGLVQLVPDGITTTGTITRVAVDQSGQHLRTYSTFEYFDDAGNRYTGEVGGSGRTVGDPISISYLPSDPKVHEVAEVVDKLRAQAPPK